jgi:flagellar protein FlgJ
MDASDFNSKLGTVAGGLAADSRSLEQLKRTARDDPRQAVKKVATQFEALFMQMVLKSMRDATPQSGLLDSKEQDMFRGMLDQQVAQQIAAKGTGLSDLIARQLGRNLPAFAASAATAGKPAVASPAGEAAAATTSRTLTPGPFSGLRPEMAIGREQGGSAGPLVAPPGNAKQWSSSSLLPLAGEGLGVRVSNTATPPTVAPARTAPPETQRQFMQGHWADAMRAQQLTGVPASFILGQAALESGWGQREIRAADGSPSYNLFGIKAGPGWQGKTTQVTTTEYEGGVPRTTVQSFRAYDSYAAAFQDWALTIGRNQRYSGAVASAGSAGGFALGMQQAGYSTDPAYAEKLASVIRTASSIRGTG